MLLTDADLVADLVTAGEGEDEEAPPDDTHELRKRKDARPAKGEHPHSQQPRPVGNCALPGTLQHVWFS